MTDEPPEVPKRRGSAPTSLSNGVDIQLRKSVNQQFSTFHFFCYNDKTS